MKKIITLLMAMGLIFSLSENPVANIKTWFPPSTL